MTFQDLQALHIAPATTLRDTIRAIDASGRLGTALIVDEEQRLSAVITDGDIRRGLLAGLSLDTPIGELLAIKALEPNPHAITAAEDTDPTELLRLMQERHVRQIPLLDEAGRVTNIVTLNELLPTQPQGLRAVIMAGGFGTRLKPLTDQIPKPMLPVGGRPVMEWIVEKLRHAGIRQMKVTTHFMPEKIMEHFGNGQSFGVEMEYVNEDRPLGTGGALGLIAQPNEPFLVINGDVLTEIDFQKMLDFHEEHEADMTVAINLHQVEVPFGVIDCTGPLITKLQEKPRMNLLVNAGIYLLQPTVYQFIPQDTPFNMTDLIQWLLNAGRRVVGFPIREYWMDIGHHPDYAQAQKDFLNGHPTHE
ncbi:MAG TPA: nucleotidyltransferase family protein [Holophaga sp.]|nr:nucleotidyltransferase family protein [Holophaga sp.]